MTLEEILAALDNLNAGELAVVMGRCKERRAHIMHDEAIARDSRAHGNTFGPD